MGVVTKPFTFTDGTVAVANEVNSNLDTLYTVVNGNIGTANLATDSVDTDELVDDAVNDDKIDWGTGTDQVSAADIPIADSGSYYVNGFIEGALQEISVGTELNTWKLSRDDTFALSMTHEVLATASRTWTFQDATDTVVGLATSDTLTNKTLTSPALNTPDINGGTWYGTIDGNWTAAGETCANLGTVTTADINGGTWQGTIDGAWTASGQTCADLGTVTTADINGGTIDGVPIGAASHSSGKFTTGEFTLAVDMNSQRITELGDATTASDALNYGQAILLALILN